MSGIAARSVAKRQRDTSSTKMIAPVQRRPINSLAMKPAAQLRRLSRSFSHGTSNGTSPSNYLTSCNYIKYSMVVPEVNDGGCRIVRRADRARPHDGGARRAEAVWLVRRVRPDRGDRLLRDAGFQARPAVRVRGGGG